MTQKFSGLSITIMEIGTRCILATKSILSLIQHILTSRSLILYHPLNAKDQHHRPRCHPTYIDFTGEFANIHLAVVNTPMAVRVEISATKAKAIFSPRGMAFSTNDMPFASRCFSRLHEIFSACASRMGASWTLSTRATSSKIVRNTNLQQKQPNRTSI